MLILTRKIGEKIKIGDDIEVVLVDITGANQVKIGINAPKGIPILREEVYKRIQQENIKAATTTEDVNILDNMSLNDDNKNKETKIKSIKLIRRSNGD